MVVQLSRFYPIRLTIRYPIKESAAWLGVAPGRRWGKSMVTERISVIESLKNLAAVEAEKPAPVRIDKFTDRRTELAKAALETLADLGFARTSLREIAQNTKFSHGVLHYYFKDKVDLITCCVRDYKTICVTRYDSVIETAETKEAFVEGIAEVANNSLTGEAALHRLWYDLRVQGMFMDEYRPDILNIDAELERMVWNIFSRYCSFDGITPTLPSHTLYGLFDGLFQNALFHFIGGKPESEIGLQDEIKVLLPGCVMLMQEAGY